MPPAPGLATPRRAAVVVAVARSVKDAGHQDPPDRVLADRSMNEQVVGREAVVHHEPG
jgi:hypothetical protein